jgi:hypothetical protein
MASALGMFKVAVMARDGQLCSSSLYFIVFGVNDALRNGILKLNQFFSHLLDFYIGSYVGVVAPHRMRSVSSRKPHWWSGADRTGHSDSAGL